MVATGASTKTSTIIDPTNSPDLIAGEIHHLMRGGGISQVCLRPTKVLDGPKLIGVYTALTKMSQSINLTPFRNDPNEVDQPPLELVARNGFRVRPVS